MTSSFNCDVDKSSTDASGATSSLMTGEGGCASGLVKSPFPEMSEVRDSSKAGRCLDSPERSDSRMVDNSVLRGGSGLKVTTGGPRSVQNKLSMRCNVPQYHQTYPVPHAKLTMAPGRRR